MLVSQLVTGAARRIEQTTEDLDDETPVAVPRHRVNRRAGIFEHYVNEGATLLARFGETPLHLGEVDYGAVLPEVHAQSFVVLAKTGPCQSKTALQLP